MSSISWASNCVLVIDQGTIVEQGTREVWLNQNGFYAQLIQSQLARGEVKK